jgi:hypothetical protein
MEASQQDPFYINSTATTNEQLIQSGKSVLLSLMASNVGAALAYLKLYNKRTAPVPATDVPILVIPIPASGFISVQTAGLGAVFELGIGIAITNLPADNDVTAIAAAQVKVVGSFYLN